MTVESSIDFNEAQRVIDLVREEAGRRGKAATVAVADPHGELIAFGRMDGASLAAITIAINKAYTAARAQKPTRDIGDRVRSSDDGHDIAYFGDPRFVGWGGGVPVRRNGKVIGAVGVSGLPQAEDMEVAALAVAAIEG
jgi:glc operon protein GlcG